MNESASLLGRVVSLVQRSDTLVLVLLLGGVGAVMALLVLWLLALRNYLTNTQDYFKRRLVEMKADRMVTDRDVVFLPVVHGKKTVIPLEASELLLFYTRCAYRFFPLNQRVRNVNIDLLLTDENSLDDFEVIGRGRLFFTTRMAVFENVRSRNKIAWADVTEIKVKFGWLVVFDREGCHAFQLENPDLVADFVYQVFLKEA